MSAGGDPPKMWGEKEFWGLSSEFDPDWVLTEKQKQLQRKLIELCRTTLRSNAIESDRTYKYPRANMNALAGMGLLNLLVPREFGGMAENHVCCAMVCETIARYGCPSTALVYVMHSCAVAMLCSGYKDSPTIIDILKRVDKDRLIGTLCYSDPATGGHFWYSLSSKCQYTEDDRIQLLKYGAWVTSAGFADFYVVQTVSPKFSGDYSNLTNFLLMPDEVRADTSSWSALGMHGNQSGPMVAEATLTKDRLVGPIGGGRYINEEVLPPFFYLSTSAVWNGLAMAALDISKKHVTSKVHADAGVRVCDYPIIQDYFGECMCDTTSTRCALFSIAAAMDERTKNCDWTIYQVEPEDMPRAHLLQMLMQIKMSTSANVANVVDKMLHACGGTGFKTELGLERILRDAKAGWVMGPTNEVVRQLIGKATLLGLDSLDIWFQKANHRQIHEEVKKMTMEEKQELAEKLMREVKMNASPASNEDSGASTLQDTDFHNPLNTSPPTRAVDKAVVSPGAWSDVLLESKIQLTPTGIEQLRFTLPTKYGEYLGTLPGQYIEMGIDGGNGKIISRYFSPVSSPNAPGILDICMKYESCGQFSQLLQNVNIGGSVKIRGPSGGFEYRSNVVDVLVMLVSGAGATPAIQILRSIRNNPEDKTNVILLYYADNSEEFLYKSELDEWSRQSAPRLQVYYTIGEEEPGWRGHVGYLDADMLRLARIPAPAAGARPPRRHILLCGGTSMITSCVEHLYRAGVPSTNIYIYGAFAAEQIRRVYGRHAKLPAHTCRRGDHPTQ